MGIGLYSSFHLCNKLTLFSRVKDEKPNKLEFEFLQMRNILESQKDERIESDDNIPTQVALISLMEGHINIFELEDSEFPKIGTRVELSGLDAEFFESLSKFEEVSEYLEKSVPLPFDPKFSFGNEIQDYITKECRIHLAEFKLVELSLQINTKKEILYRPYKNSDFIPAPMPPIFKELTSDDNEFFGIA